MNASLAAFILGVGLTVAIGPSAAAADADPAAYDELIEVALERYRARDWAAAREAFERAHAAEPNARALRGIGLSAYYAADHVAAAGAFEQALRERGRPLSPEQRSQVEELLQRAYAQIAQVDLEVQPTDAAIELNGRSVAAARLLLPTGSYHLKASLAGYAPHSEDFDVAAGQRLRVHIALSPEPAPIAAPMPSASPAVPSQALLPRLQPATAQPSDATPSTTAPVITGGVTLAFSTTALIFGILASDELDELQRECHRQGCTPELRTTLWDSSPITTYGTMTNVSIAAAVAGAATTAVLLVLHFDARAAKSVRLTAGRELSLTAQF